ncbi:MAG: hypothetical protein CMO98_06625 [Woeseia sp.]|nr:hypothetical protein [Woeseia sp.]
MSENLIIKIDDHNDKQANWIVVDSAGMVCQPETQGALDQAANEADGRRVIALVPGADVLTTKVNIPAKGHKLMAALPYALEEFLAQDVEELHFAIGDKGASGHTPVCVVSEERMDEWIELFRSHDISPDRMIAENHGLARIPGTVSILVTEDRLFMNDGADLTLMMEDFSPIDALKAIGVSNNESDEIDKQDQANNPRPRHLLAYCTSDTEQIYEAGWNKLRKDLDSVEVKILPDGALPKLAATVATGNGINLLQGHYGPKIEYAALFRPWRHAAALLLGFVLIAFGGKAMDLYMLTKQEELLSSSFNTEYRNMLPGAREVTDPIATIDSLRRRTGNTVEAPVFLQSMAQVSKAVQQNQNTKILAISFRAGVIDLRVSAPDVATLDKLQRIIGETGQFRAIIQSTDQVGEQISSRIQIQEETI